MLGAYQNKNKQPLLNVDLSSFVPGEENQESPTNSNQQLNLTPVKIGATAATRKEEAGNSTTAAGTTSFAFGAKKSSTDRSKVSMTTSKPFTEGGSRMNTRPSQLVVGQKTGHQQSTA